MKIHALYLYNGEKDHIIKSLEYTSKICDTIHIFGIKNKTEELNIESNNIFKHEIFWDYDFSKIRNKAIDILCSQISLDDWILSLDSDECLDPKTFWKINSILDLCSGDSTVCGLSFTIINNNDYWLSEHIYDKPTRNLKKRDIRLFRANPLLRYKGRIEESLDINPFLVHDIDIKIYHHSQRYTDEENSFLKERQAILEKWNITSESDKKSFMKEEEKFYSVFDKNLKSIMSENKKPKIGFFTLHYDPPIGGAERSMHNYFSILSDFYDIEVFCFLNEDGGKFDKEINILRDNIKITKSNLPIATCVNNFIRNENPSAIITQLLQSEIIIDLAHRNGIPCIYFVHGFFEDICQHYLLNSCKETNLETCCFGAHCPNAQRQDIHSQKYNRCKSIICNSHYTEKIFSRFFPTASEKVVVVPPNFNYESFNFLEKTNFNTVLAINTSQSKGRNVVINLAFMNPDLKFIYVDSKKKDLQNIPIPPNMEFKPRLSREEMVKLYNEVSVVVYPTLMDETFGGVPCEAVLSGTPIVCPNKGNLSNIVMDGKNGKIVNNSYKKEDWNKALHEAIKICPPRDLARKLLSSLNTKVNSEKIKKEIEKCISLVNKNIVCKVEDYSKDKIVVKNSNKKKILFLARFLLPPLGGGEWFHFTVLKHLQKIGYDCKGACYFDGKSNIPFSEERETNWGPIPVRQAVVRSFHDLDAIVEKEKPDLVLTMSYDALSIIKAAHKNKAKAIFGTHFWRNICEVPEVFENMLKRPLSSVKLLTQFHPAFHLADEYYVNSKFMQLGVEKYVGKKIERIIHPMADLDRIVADKIDKKYITFVNPEYYKGGENFINIAKKLSRYNFLCIGQAPFPDKIESSKRINTNLANMHNIKVIESCENMSEIYKQTAILLVPAIVDETFSMVTLEAMWNGIPVIVSPNGNLPFLVGDSSIILELSDLTTWTNIIEQIMGDEDYYNILSESCKKRSREFSPDKELEKFEKMVKLTIGDP